MTSSLKVGAACLGNPKSPAAKTFPGTVGIAQGHLKKEGRRKEGRRGLGGRERGINDLLKFKFTK